MLFDEYIDGEFVAVLLNPCTLIESQFRKVLLVLLAAKAGALKSDNLSSVDSICLQSKLVVVAKLCMEKLNSIVIFLTLTTYYVRLLLV